MPQGVSSALNPRAIPVIEPDGGVPGSTTRVNLVIGL